MGGTPHNLCTDLETLSSLWEQHHYEEENVLRSGLTGLELFAGILLSSVERAKGAVPVLQILPGMEAQPGLPNLFPFSNPPPLKKASAIPHSKHIAYLKVLHPAYTPTVDKVTKGYFDLLKNIVREIGIGDRELSVFSKGVKRTFSTRYDHQGKNITENCVAV